jgi:hypothetical protein
MRTSYPAKSGRLNDVVEEVVHFFEAKGFLVSTEKKGSQTILSIKTGESARDRIIGVSLEGDTAGSLRVTFESFERSPVLINSGLPPLLGGGFLTLRRLRNSETIERLEREFWEMFDGLMASS